MQRVYYVLDKVSDYYILNCASYGFEDDEELMSSSNDVIYKGNNKLIIGKYVCFIDERINKGEDKYIVDGEAHLFDNDINDEDRKIYDMEFDLSIEAYKNNDEVGINRWNEYFNSYEKKFMNFKEIIG